MMQSEIRKFFTSNDLKSDEIKEKGRKFGADYLNNEWKLLMKEEVDVTQISGGQSNLLYLVSTNSPKFTESTSTPKRFLIRIHCQQSSQIFNDTIIFVTLAERGLGPKCYGIFEGGRLEEYLDSITLDEGNVSTEEHAKKIGALYPKYHAIDMPFPKYPKAFEMIRGWLDDYRKNGGGVFKLKQHSVFYEHGTPTEITADEIENEIQIFEKWSKIFEDTVIFSHNDLFALNILKLKSTGEMVFIDFEYASYNWRGYDLGMHLSEYGFDYRDTTWPGVKINQNIYENHPNIRLLCESYIATLYKMKAENPTQIYPKSEEYDGEVEQLMEECEFFYALGNLLSAAWAMKCSIVGLGLVPSNSRGLDLGMHLSEYGFDYRDTTWPGVKINQNVYENHPTIRLFCESYVETLKKMKIENPKQLYPKDEDYGRLVEQLMDECEFFYALGNLHWAVWSMKNSVLGHDNGIDLDVAASDRLALYFHLKKKSEKIYQKYHQ